MRSVGQRDVARVNSVLNMRARAGRSRAGRLPNSMLTHSTGRFPAAVRVASMRSRISRAVRRPIRSLVPRATMTAEARVVRAREATTPTPWRVLRPTFASITTFFHAARTAGLEPEKLPRSDAPTVRLSPTTNKVPAGAASARPTAMPAPMVSANATIPDAARRGASLRGGRCDTY